MGTTAPRPNNFKALWNAWDNPTRFALELAKYYQQLEASGHRQKQRHIHEAEERE